MLRTRHALLTLALTAGAVAAVRPFVAQDMPQPTDEHRMVLGAVGEWEGNLTMYMPGMEPTTAPCSETVTAVGEFWTTSRFTMEFMDMPFTGVGCNGYDTKKKKFVGTWIDSMTTSLSVMEGDFDKAKNALVMRWTAPDPATGEMIQHRSETVFRADAYVMQMFQGEGGEKTMEIKMKRKAAATDANADKDADKK